MSDPPGRGGMTAPSSSLGFDMLCTFVSISIYLFMVQHLLEGFPPHRVQHRAVREGISNKCIGEESRGCLLSHTSFFFLFFFSLDFLLFSVIYVVGEAVTEGGAGRKGGGGSNGETT